MSLCKHPECIRRRKELLVWIITMHINDPFKRAKLRKELMEE